MHRNRLLSFPKRVNSSWLVIGMASISLCACAGYFYGAAEKSAEYEIDRSTCCDAGRHCPCTQKALSCHGGCGNGAGGIVGAFNGRAYGCCLPDP